MTAVLDDQVRLMESAWFMSYPHDVYARLRNEAPVYWSPRDEVWAISKYEDIRWISKQPELFSNRYHIYVAGANVEDDGQEIRDDTGMPARPSCDASPGMGPLYVDNLVMADGARHRFLRKIASHAFTPKAINEIEAEVQRIAVELFDEIPDDVEVDFVDTVAAPLPMIMIALMLGVPLERPRRLPARGPTRSSRCPRTRCRSPATKTRSTRRSATSSSSATYFTEQLKDRVANPRDDLLTKLTQARVGGQAPRARGAALDGPGAADRRQRDHPRPHRRRRQGAGRAPRPAGDPRGVTRADAAARSRSSCATSRRSRTCAGPRSTTSSSAGSRSSGATSSACSTRRPTATRTPGAR